MVVICYVYVSTHFKIVSLGKDGNSSTGQKQTSEWEKKRENQDESGYSGNINSWASMKEYDDDHDSKWFEEENAWLGKDTSFKFGYVQEIL